MNGSVLAALHLGGTIGAVVPPMALARMRHMRSGCCARASQRPRRRRAAEQRDELAPFQLIELHPVPRQPGPDYRISNWQRISQEVGAGRGRCNRRVTVSRSVRYFTPRSAMAVLASACDGRLRCAGLHSPLSRA